MPLLFKTQRRNKLVLHPDAIKLTTHLKKLSSDEVYYTILAYDYYSKYHQYPLRDRKLRAEREIFGAEAKNIEEGNKKLKDAIEEYKSLQYDYRRELVNTYQEKIELNRAELISASSLAVKKLLDANRMLDAEINKLQHEIDKNEEALELQGGGRISFIEEWRENRKKYQRNKQLEKDVLRSQEVMNGVPTDN